MVPKSMKTTKKTKLLDPLSPASLTAHTETKLFGFKCDVREGTLAEREVERRIHTFFAVLNDDHIELIDASNGDVPKTLTELLPSIMAYLSPIYREADKELSTANIIIDTLEYFRSQGLVLKLSLPRKEV